MIPSGLRGIPQKGLRPSRSAGSRNSAVRGKALVPYDTDTTAERDVGDWEREFGAGVFAEDVIDEINRFERREQLGETSPGEGSARLLTVRAVRDNGGSLGLSCTCGWRARVNLDTAPDDIADDFILAVLARRRWPCPNCKRNPEAVVKDRDGKRIWTCSGSPASTSQSTFGSRSLARSRLQKSTSR